MHASKTEADHTMQENHVFETQTETGWTFLKFVYWLNKGHLAPGGIWSKWALMTRQPRRWTGFAAGTTASKKTKRVQCTVPSRLRTVHFGFCKLPSISVQHCLSSVGRRVSGQRGELCCIQTVIRSDNAANCEASRIASERSLEEAVMFLAQCETQVPGSGLTCRDVWTHRIVQLRGWRRSEDSIQNINLT